MKVFVWHMKVFQNLLFFLRPRKVPVSLSPSCVTRRKPRDKKNGRARNGRRMEEGMEEKWKLAQQEATAEHESNILLFQGSYYQFAISLWLFPVPREFKTLQFSGAEDAPVGRAHKRTPHTMWRLKLIVTTEDCFMYFAQCANLVLFIASRPKQARIRKVCVIFKSGSSPGEKHCLHSPCYHSSVSGEHFHRSPVWFSTVLCDIRLCSSNVNNFQSWMLINACVAFSRLVNNRASNL